VDYYLAGYCPPRLVALGIHHGRLYPNLDTLVDKGLVEKGQKDRRTNVYSITNRVQRELDARRD
jgi:DNA-binding PadR family transcriptional regulator